MTALRYPNLSVLHMYVGGGTQPELKTVKVGLLGADYTLENGRYRLAHIYSGENWNPQLHSPPNYHQHLPNSF